MLPRQILHMELGQVWTVLEIIEMNTFPTKLLFLSLLKHLSVFQFVLFTRIAYQPSFVTLILTHFPRSMIAVALSCTSAVVTSHLATPLASRQPWSRTLANYFIRVVCRTWIVIMKKGLLINWVIHSCIIVCFLDNQSFLITANYSLYAY